MSSQSHHKWLDNGITQLYDLFVDAKKIFKLRERAGWSQSQMAKAIGSSKMIISHWETELKKPSGITTRFLALLYSLSDPELKKISKRLETLSKEDSDA